MDTLLYELRFVAIKTLLFKELIYSNTKLIFMILTIYFTITQL